MTATAGRRGHFRPAEDEQLKSWFARTVTVRAALWELIRDAGVPVGGEPGAVRTEEELRCFLIGYAAACRLVCLDRLVVEEVATSKLCRRKLDEGAPELRLPRKQLTAAFESLADPANALSMEEAMKFAEAQRARLDQLGSDPLLGWAARELPRWEQALDPSKRGFLRRFFRFTRYSLRRRGSSAGKRVQFAVLESSGRLVSNLRDTSRPKRAAAERRRLAELLRPGDVLITRHDRAMSNLFLPGYWPHSALYLGTAAERKRLGVKMDPEREARLSEELTVLEALKDGVLFRSLDGTLAVDAVAVVRPRLSEEQIGQALSRAVTHEGKLYNFDFDFFRSDRLVCTEVVYRAYDGLGGLELPLRERSGRLTFSAEDLLDLALAGRGFEPVAVFGAPSCHGRLVVGKEASAEALARSHASGRDGREAGAGAQASKR